MPGISAALVPILGALTSAAPTIGAAGTILSAFGGPKAPKGDKAPGAPEVAAAPEAPEVSSAEDVAAGGDQASAEASKVRASKRRKATESKRLFSLDQEEDESVTLTKTLLGG